MTKAMYDVQGKAERYAETGRPEDRDAVIAAAQPLIRYHVQSFTKNAPSHLQGLEDDLAQVASVRLVEDLHKYDPEISKFATWSAIRIRGAIYDFIRGDAWASRGILSQLTMRQKAVSELVAMLGRTPNEEEVAEQLPALLRDVVTKKLQQSLKRKPKKLEIDAAIHRIINSRDPNVIGFEQCLYETEAGRQTTLGDLLVDRRRAENDMASDSLTELLKHLDICESTILYLYYSHNVTMKEIGRILGLSESRVSQMHSKCLVSLQQLFPDRRAASEDIYV